MAYALGRPHNTYGLTHLLLWAFQARAPSIGPRSPLRCDSYRAVSAPRATASSATARSSCHPWAPPAPLPAVRRTATRRRTLSR